MKKNKVIIALMVILFILAIGLGVFFFKNSNNDVNESPIQQEPANEPQTVEDKINENEKNYEEHCLNGLCVEILDFRSVENYGGFSLVISNKSNSIIASGFTNMIFSLPNGEIKTFIYNKELAVGESIETQVTFTDLSYMEATDYRLEEPSLEEIMNYYANMAN